MDYTKIKKEELEWLENQIQENYKKSILSDKDLSNVVGGVKPLDRLTAVLMTSMSILSCGGVSSAYGGKVNSSKNGGIFGKIGNSLKNYFGTEGCVTTFDKIKKLFVPVSVAGVGVVGICGLTYFIIHKIREAKNPKEAVEILNDAINQETANEKLTAEKLIVIVEKLREDNNDVIVGDLSDKFNDLINDIRKSSESKTFDINEPHFRNRLENLTQDLFNLRNPQIGSSTSDQESKKDDAPADEQSEFFIDNPMYLKKYEEIRNCGDKVLSNIYLKMLRDSHLSPEKTTDLMIKIITIVENFKTCLDNESSASNSDKSLYNILNSTSEYSFHFITDSKIKRMYQEAELFDRTLMDMCTINHNFSENKGSYRYKLINLIEHYKSFTEKFRTINKYSFLKDLASRISEVTEQIQHVFEDRLNSLPHKTPEQKQAKIENIKRREETAQEKRSYGENGRYIPYLTEKSEDRGNVIYSKGCDEVFIYLDTRTGKKVLLKLEEQGVSRTLLQLNSPYLPKVLDIVDMGNGIEGIVMEYISANQWVTDYVKTISNNPIELLRICKEAVLGLKELKRCGMGYPELKPDHFLIDKHGHFKFIDFDQEYYWTLLPELDFLKNYILYGNESLYQRLFLKCNSLGLFDDIDDNNLDNLNSLEKVIEAIDSLSKEISQ